MYYYLLLQKFVCIHKHGEILEIDLANGVKKIQNIRDTVLVYLYDEDSRFLGFLNVTKQQASALFYNHFR